MTADELKARINVNVIDEHGETYVALSIDDRTTVLTTTQAKHLARLLSGRADGKAVYSQQKISETTQQYAELILHDFIPKVDQLTLGGRILTNDLITIYHEWREAELRAHGIPYNYRTSNAVIGRAMKAAGFQMQRSSGRRFYIGLSLLNPTAPSDSDQQGGMHTP